MRFSLSTTTIRPGSPLRHAHLVPLLAIGLSFGLPDLHAWEPTTLPGEKSEAPAWYRCRVQVPDRLVVPKTNSSSDLWRDSTMLVLASLPGHTEVFLNGKSIITSDGIPIGQSMRFKIPKDILVVKKFNTLVIRTSAGGILTEAPFIIDYFNELHLGPAWEISTTKPTAADLQEVAEQPATAFYTADGFRPSSTPLDSTIEPIPGQQSPPADALAALQTDDDLIVDQLLHEPEIAQPTHISFDARGRMWVTQYRQYPFPKGLKMLSRDQFYRAKYDRVPAAPRNHIPGADVISIHEDTNGDGTYDNHKHALKGLNMATSALRGWGGLWVTHPPYLLFYPDADGDDIPDGDPEVRLAGFGMEDTHSVANGLTWGPDGWLYGGHGSTSTSRITRPGIDPEGSEGIYNDGCHVWRYHPRTKEYEIFADGTGNVFGVSFDAEGRLFVGHNGANTRGWYMIQGGQYLKQGKNPDKFGPPTNPYSFGELPMMRSTTPIKRFSIMSMIVQGTALPDRLQGKFLCVDPLHHELIAAERHPHGSNFETTDIGKPLRSKDVTFRPTFLTNSPDGSMVIADFCEEYIAHGQHFQGQIDPSSGRIYRLRGKEQNLETDYNLEAKTDLELVANLTHPNLWHRQTSVRLLGQRANPKTVPALLAALAKPTAHPAVDALWALHQMGKLDEATAIQALDHPSPIVRSWTVRLLGDQRHLSEKFAAKLVTAAASTPVETSAEERCQILSTASRLPVSESLTLVKSIRFDSADVDDPYLPLMLWFAIESRCEDNRDLVLAMFEDATFWARPMIRQHILPRVIRRFAEAGSRRDFLTCAKLFQLAPAAEYRTILQAGFDQAFEGRVPPAFPDALLAELGTGSLSMQVRQGDPEAIAKARAILEDPAAPNADRLSAIRAFGTAAHPQVLPALLKIVTTPDTDDTSLQEAALTALQIYETAEIGALAEAAPDLRPELQARAINLLASRKSWTLTLLASKALPQLPVDADLVARMRLHDDAEITKLLDQHFPESGSPTPSLRADAIRKILAAKPGDPYRGKAIYSARCASCHILFFEGGKVGPDLTRYQRNDLPSMLTSILDPNAEIREGYENYIATTKDGRILSGFLAENDANTIVLRGFDGSNTTIPREDIEKLTAVGRSLMPEGLINGLDDQQLRDFFAYLERSQPIGK